MKTVKELTREELIKALRNCSTSGKRCNSCPLFRSPPIKPVNCYNEIMIHAADILEASVTGETVRFRKEN